VSRVLVVDDEPQMRRTLEINLAGRGYEVDLAPTGEIALELAARRHPDLVILDLGLPGMDGIEVVRGLREWSSVPILVLSARETEKAKVAALDAGATAYVEKTVATEALVDELLGGAGLLDAAVRALTPPARENFAADPKSVAAARRFIAGTLEGWHLTELADTITLLLSELVTNAIVHADAPPDVTVRLLDDRVHVEVSDTRSETVRAQELNNTSTSGRGLALVDALAAAWGSVALPEGKIVWFDVARS